jgi:nucleotide-binding universal stress UspA family protein
MLPTGEDCACPIQETTMLKTILVGLHGSEFSTAASSAALELARQNQAAILAIGIVDVPRLTPAESVPLGAGGFKGERDAAVLAAERQRIAQLLGEFEQRARSQNLAPRTLLLEGDPAELLVRESHRADLLVVGKKHAPHQEWEHASNTLERVLRQTARPVLCVPAERVAGSPVLIAYDGSLVAAKAIQLFIHVGLGVGRPIHLLTMAADAAAVSARAAELLQAHGLNVQQHPEAPAGAAGKRILELAGQLGAGTIVMGSYGHSRIRDFIFGSVTSTVLRDATVPVFLYH